MVAYIFHPHLNYSFFNNTVLEWLVALFLFLVIVLLLKIFKSIVISRLKKLVDKSKAQIDSLLVESLKSIHWPFYVLIAFYASFKSINISQELNKYVYYFLLIAAVYYLVKFSEKIIDHGAKIIIQKQKDAGEHNIGLVRLLSTSLKVVAWSGSIILILSNLGLNVTSLIAGLGIGGIAIALALQNILGDLFSSLAIYFDKPFKIGDFIVVGEQMGTVKRVGLKTTRIQLLQGEELVISNSEVTKSLLRNFGVMEKRRIVFNIGVTYDTRAEKLKKIPGLIEKIIVKNEKTEIDRIHFKSFGESALIFEAVFYYNSGNYKEYMDAQQNINLDLVEIFEKEKIAIAFPTRTIHIEK